jgi:hypothetical protein
MRKKLLASTTWHCLLVIKCKKKKKKQTKVKKQNKPNRLLRIPRDSQAKQTEVKEGDIYYIYYCPTPRSFSSSSF